MFSNPNTIKFSSPADFEKQAKSLREQGYTHVPVMRETLADLDTPVSTYLKLADKPYTYLFESVQGGEEWGRYSIIGLPSNKVYRFIGKTLKVEVAGKVIKTREVADPLATVRELQSEYRVADYDGLPEMIGGLVGYFGYETVEYIEPRLAQLSAKYPKPDSIGAADILLMVSEDVLVFDNLSGRIFLVALADLNQMDAYEQAEQRLTKRISTLTKSFAYPAQSNTSTNDNEPQSYFAQTDFEAAVEKCRDYIRAGDIMQVVLSQRLSLDYYAPSFDLYRALRTINPSPYMYFLNLGDFDVVGSSPEILVRLQDDTVTVRPIAGTRKRGKDHEHDLALEKELLSDEKELAEHLMLIDLGRNDVGRVAKVGSVELTDKMIIERYSHVMHIVSNVEATLEENFDAIDVLKATFPAGTVSGAPKIRAMEIIAEFEPVKRGVYSGAVGYLGWNGNMDTAIAIRTAVIKDNKLYIQAGAGIVDDSVPEYEWKETLSKAKVLFSAADMVNSGMGFDTKGGDKC